MAAPVVSRNWRKGIALIRHGTTLQHPPCRTLLETSRTLLVWLGALLLFYLGLPTPDQLGEPWCNHSWVQAAG